jgi:hypothetical protein
MAAYELGANCIIGLNIDMDEISGKGKSMFMLTALGTAVIIEKEPTLKLQSELTDEKFENVGVDRIDTLRKKKAIIKKVDSDALELNDETWEFITLNQVDEIFLYLLKEYSKHLTHEQSAPTPAATFRKQLLSFIDNLNENKKVSILYDYIETEKNEALAVKLCSIVNELNLLDITKSFALIRNSDFHIQKRGLWTLTYDKPYYSKQDITDLKEIMEYIQKNFPERGVRSMKKQLLSSKEKEVWKCECGTANNEIGKYCNNCDTDIYGFKRSETKLSAIEDFVSQKIELIEEFIK